MLRPSSDSARGVVAAIAWRPKDGDAMAEIPECTVQPGRGITLENRKPGKREITLISEEAWQDVCRELGVELPWNTRRANVLIRGLNLALAIGHRLRLGPVVLMVHGETKPCGIMDRQHGGLRRALGPGCRGGVYAQVLTGGTIHIGDPVCLEC
jgi:MOSC domain-containing protein YiiM